VEIVATYICAPDLNLGRTTQKPFSQKKGTDFHLRGSPNCTLPDGRYAPPFFQKGTANSAIPNDIRFELRLPELLAARRVGGIATALVAVPKAAMDENDGSMLRKD
jgi:hypothetical protein